MLRKIGMAGCMVLLIAAGTVHASSGNGGFKGYPAVKLIVNDQEITSDVPAVNVDGTTLIPMRVVAEKLGATVNWNAETQTVVITGNENQHVNPAADKTNEKNEIQAFITQFLNDLQETKNLHERIKLIHQIQEADPDFKRTIKDLEQIEQTVIKNETGKIDDLTVKFAQIKQASNEQNSVLFKSIDSQISNYYDVINKYRNALKEYDQYQEHHETDDLRNFLLFMQDGYVLISDIERFLLEQQLSAN